MDTFEMDMLAIAVAGVHIPFGQDIFGFEVINKNLVNDPFFHKCLQISVQGHPVTIHLHPAADLVCREGNIASGKYSKYFSLLAFSSCVGLLCSFCNMVAKVIIFVKVRHFINQLRNMVRVTGHGPVF